jgi:hypothetical protein
MLAKLRNWLNDKSSTRESTSADRLKSTRTYVSAQSTKNTEPKPAQAANPDNAPVSSRHEDRASNENTVVRNKYVREDTGTHETLTIIDNSLPDPDEEADIDPYNTGGFDRSKNWNNRFRK